MSHRPRRSAAAGEVDEQALVRVDWVDMMRCSRTGHAIYSE